MIGVFDSGLGGLTVVREIYRQLPGYRLVYFGDTARTPYGGKSAELVSEYAVQDAEFLISRGAKVIVVACNTASALAMDALRRRIRVPVFEVVTPAVAKAAELTGGRIGVIGTRGTVRSRIYEKKLAEAKPQAEIFSEACPLFVPLVEEDWHRGPVVEAVAKKYLNRLRLRRVDTLILGCTHYPFLRRVIAKTVGRRVRLIDPARETVNSLKGFLADHPELESRLARNGRNRFFVSDRTDLFERMASRWLGEGISLEEVRLG